MIYLNNAETTLLKPNGVKQAPPASAEDVKTLTAKLLGIKNPKNIILTEGASQAMELALRSFLKEGDHVIATDLEHDTTCQILNGLTASLGITVSYVGVNPYGRLLYEEIEPLIGEKTKVIVCAHGCSVTGNITDLEQVTAIARRHKIPVISDGAQTVGATIVNLEELGVDVYCFTAHKKLMGPKNLGGICLKEGTSLDEALLKDLSPISEETLGAFYQALSFIFEKGIYGISIFPHRLAKRFFESIKSMDSVTVYGDFGTSSRIPTVSAKFGSFSPEEVKSHLGKKFGIKVKAGLQEGRRMHQALGTDAEGLVRFSFGYFNTRQDVNDTIWAIMDLMGLDDLYLLA